MTENAMSPYSANTETFCVRMKLLQLRNEIMHLMMNETKTCKQYSKLQPIIFLRNQWTLTQEHVSTGVGVIFAIYTYIYMNYEFIQTESFVANIITAVQHKHTLTVL